MSSFALGVHLSASSADDAEAVFRVPEDLYGWLSKPLPPFGSPKYEVPYYTKDTKRDHNFDNHPYA